jgi:hypothetical protein
MLFLRHSKSLTALGFAEVKEYHSFDVTSLGHSTEDTCITFSILIRKVKSKNLFVTK